MCRSSSRFARNHPQAKGTTFNLSSVLRGDQNAKRSVALQYEIVADNEVVLAKKTPYSELEPRYPKALKTRLQLDPAALAKLHAAAHPQLRLTIAVEKYPGDSVKDADEATVAGCEFLGTISGQSMIGGLATSLGAQKAMKSARVTGRETWRHPHRLRVGEGRRLLQHQLIYSASLPLPLTQLDCLSLPSGKKRPPVCFLRRPGAWLRLLQTDTAADDH